jgi:hypothetical protein
MKGPRTIDLSFPGETKILFTEFLHDFFWQIYLFIRRIPRAKKGWIRKAV